MFEAVLLCIVLLPVAGISGALLLLLYGKRLIGCLYIIFYFGFLQDVVYNFSLY